MERSILMGSTYTIIQSLFLVFVIAQIPCLVGSEVTDKKYDTLVEHIKALPQELQEIICSLSLECLRQRNSGLLRAYSTQSITLKQRPDWMINRYYWFRKYGSESIEFIFYSPFMSMWKNNGNEGFERGVSFGIAVIHALTEKGIESQDLSNAMKKHRYNGDGSLFFVYNHEQINLSRLLRSLKVEPTCAPFIPMNNYVQIKKDYSDKTNSCTMS